MSPLARLFSAQKLNDHDRFIAECLPLMHKRLLLEGKAGNQIIDVLFELSYRLQCIGSMTQSKPIYRTGVDAWNALIAACDVASDQGKQAINPSTDQKRVICAAMDTLAKLAGVLTNKVFIESNLQAQAYMARMTRKAA